MSIGSPNDSRDDALVLNDGAAVITEGVRQVEDLRVMLNERNLRDSVLSTVPGLAVLIEKGSFDELVKGLTEEVGANARKYLEQMRVVATDGKLVLLSVPKGVYEYGAGNDRYASVQVTCVGVPSPERPGRDMVVNLPTRGTERVIGRSETGNVRWRQGMDLSKDSNYALVTAWGMRALFSTAMNDPSMVLDRT